MKDTFFIGNRKRLQEAVDAPLVVVPANAVVQMSADQPFSFIQDKNFWYLTGSEEPDLWLVLDKKEHTEYLILPKRANTKDLWDGAIDFSSLKAKSGIKTVLGHDEGLKLFQNRLRHERWVGMPLPSADLHTHLAIHPNPARQLLLEMVKKTVPFARIDDVRVPIARLRQKKQPEEMAAIRRAIDITHHAIDEVVQATTANSTERQLAQQLTASFWRQGAEGESFASIVATGSHAATIHHVPNDTKLANGVLLFDVGASYMQYAADISRTFHVGKVDVFTQDVYAAVLRVQNQAMTYLKSGVLLREYELFVEEQIGSELKKLGVIDVVSKKAVRAHYPHACSHFLGLDVHDAGDYEQPLAEDMVITVEPGIYLPKEHIGVRIEDNVRITLTGCELLSTPAHHTLSAIMV